MKLSAQEEYGLRCLLRLGREGEGVSLTISELSQREGISAPNVAKLMRVLRRGGYVRSTRGKEGGYTLARPAEGINLGEALAVLGGRLYDPAFCGRHSGVERLCTHMPDCSIRSVWRLVQGAVDQVLGRLSLRDLLCSEEQMSGWKGPSAGNLPVVSRPTA